MLLLPPCISHLPVGPWFKPPLALPTSPETQSRSPRCPLLDNTPTTYTRLSSQGNPLKTGHVRLEWFLSSSINSHSWISAHPPLFIYLGPHLPLYSPFNILALLNPSASTCVKYTRPTPAPRPFWRLPEMSFPRLIHSALSLTFWGFHSTCDLLNEASTESKAASLGLPSPTNAVPTTLTLLDCFPLHSCTLVFFMPTVSEEKFLH